MYWTTLYYYFSAESSLPPPPPPPPPPASTSSALAASSTTSPPISVTLPSVLKALLPPSSSHQLPLPPVSNAVRPVTPTPPIGGIGVAVLNALLPPSHPPPHSVQNNTTRSTSPTPLPNSSVPSATMPSQQFVEALTQLAAHTSSLVTNNSFSKKILHPPNKPGKDIITV